jgi:alkylation response protein AidB-like acyl-CoA dehydrogenase
MNDPRTPDGLGTTETQAVRDLSGLLDALRATAAQRDREGGHAAQEKQWIADAGLLTLAVPQEFGGSGARWVHIYEAIRAIARVDSALAHLLGFQCLQVVSVDVWGNEAQRAHYLKGTADARWWWGNAVNPIDPRLVATATSDGGYRLEGKKGFCSGTRGSQMMTVSAHDPETGKPVLPLCRPRAKALPSTKTGTRSASARRTAAACRSRTFASSRAKCCIVPKRCPRHARHCARSYRNWC